MAEERDIEKKSKKVLESRVGDSESDKSAAMEEAKSYLSQIQAERQSNLDSQSIVNNQEQGNTETMKQAAQIVALGEAENLKTQQAQVSSQTAATLKKYGLGKPGIQRTQSRDVKVSPQQIIINNNTQSTTTNQVNAVGPVQGRALSFTPGGGEDSTAAKFKTWIQQSFQRQAEEGVKREKDYKKREWSLSRTGNKMLERLSDIGKSFAESLSPKRIAESFNNDLGMMFKMIGLHKIATNWQNTLRLYARIEEAVVKFVGFFGIKIPFLSKKSGGDNTNIKIKGLKGAASSKLSGFKRTLIEFLGGDPNNKETSTIGGALKNLFMGKGGFIDLLGDKLKILFEERAESIKAVPPPNFKIANGDIGATIGQAFNWVANLLMAALGGTAGLKSSITSQMTNKALAREQSGGEPGGGSYSKRSFVKDTIIGDADIFIDKKLSLKTGESLDSSGRYLSNDTSSSYKQSSVIAREISDLGSNKRSPMVITRGLSRLEDAAKSSNNEGAWKNRTIVDPDFVNNFSSLLGMSPEEFCKEYDIKSLPYKFVRRDRDVMEINRAGDQGYIQSYAEGKLAGATVDMADSVGLGVPGRLIAGRAVGNGIVGEAYNYGKAFVKGTMNLTAASKRLALVPGNSKESGIPLPENIAKEFEKYNSIRNGFKVSNAISLSLAGGLPAALLFNKSLSDIGADNNYDYRGKKKVGIRFNSMSAKGIAKLKKKLQEVSGTKMDYDNVDENNLRGFTNWASKQRQAQGKKGWLSVDTEHNAAPKQVEALKRIEENKKARESEFEAKRENSQVGKFINNLNPVSSSDDSESNSSSSSDGSSSSSSGGGIKGFFGKVGDTTKNLGKKVYGKARDFTATSIKSHSGVDVIANKYVDLLAKDEDLDLTRDQAAGIIAALSKFNLLGYGDGNSVSNNKSPFERTIKKDKYDEYLSGFDKNVIDLKNSKNEDEPIKYGFGFLKNDLLKNHPSILEKIKATKSAENSAEVTLSDYLSEGKNKPDEYDYKNVRDLAKEILEFKKASKKGTPVPNQAKMAEIRNHKSNNSVDTINKNLPNGGQYQAGNGANLRTTTATADVKVANKPISESNVQRGVSNGNVRVDDSREKALNEISTNLNSANKSAAQATLNTLGTADSAQRNNNITFNTTNTTVISPDSSNSSGDSRLTK